MKQKTMPAILATSFLAATLFTPAALAEHTVKLPAAENQAAILVDSFTDVPNDHFAYEAIYYLHNLGYISGKGNHQFAPQASITRAEAALMIVNVTGIKATDSYSLQVSDVSANHFAYDALRALEQKKIMQGYEKKMRPNDPITRAEVSVLLSKSFNYAEPARFHHFTDVNRNAWSYEYINKLAENGITSQQGANFMPNKQTTRAEFSMFVARSLNDRFK
ncbi:S-layer homology domain-containing protein [Alkalihalophilus marmarensis]|uniref:S-layer homology domain-containing protein n=1 Tax=Alkalihalophilus marmarensis TaxID=521377 RepID=UPI002DB7DC53|nr:S-layer homology domain-containing protein [Alkalihalophilus marmarensis]MEC2071301.1 S-layer homology domain-containing protein [Alkalihalophilus marmarensis]